MILLKITFFIYIFPVIIGILLMLLFEFLISRLRYENYSVKDITPLVFFPLSNWILIVILPFGIIIFGSEYLGKKLENILNKI